VWTDGSVGLRYVEAVDGIAFSLRGPGPDARPRRRVGPAARATTAKDDPAARAVRRLVRHHQSTVTDVHPPRDRSQALAGRVQAVLQDPLVVAEPAHARFRETRLADPLVINGLPIARDQEVESPRFWPRSSCGRSRPTLKPPHEVQRGSPRVSLVASALVVKATHRARRAGVGLDLSDPRADQNLLSICSASTET